MLLNSGVGTFFTISTGGRTGATVAILHRQLDSSAAGEITPKNMLWLLWTNFSVSNCFIVCPITVWNFSWLFYDSDFTWNQFWGLWKCLIFHFYTFGCSEFYFFEFLYFLEAKFYQIIRIQSPKNGKNSSLELQVSPILISRKIWVTKTFWFFHNVPIIDYCFWKCCTLILCETFFCDPHWLKND